MDKTRYNRIKAELAEAGRQGKHLAKHMNVHVTTISDWCTNTNQPSIQHLYEVAEFLQIDVRRLLVPNRWLPAETILLSEAAEEAPAYKTKKRKAAKKSKKPAATRRKPG